MLEFKAYRAQIPHDWDEMHDSVTESMLVETIACSMSAGRHWSQERTRKRENRIEFKISKQAQQNFP
jgi:hypothetical protein